VIKVSASLGIDPVNLADQSATRCARLAVHVFGRRESA
jgi:hypothetical protein